MSMIYSNNLVNCGFYGLTCRPKELAPGSPAAVDLIP